MTKRKSITDGSLQHNPNPNPNYVPPGCQEHKKCYGKCPRCVWRYNGGCSEWGKRSNWTHEGVKWWVWGCSCR